MKSIRPGRTVLRVAALLLGGLAVGGAAGEAQLATFEARYDVEYKGRDVGESKHSITYDAERDRYRFETFTQAGGLARLLRPRPVVEQSEFALRGGTIRPLEFRYRDGTRKGGDDVRIAFDWEAGQAAVSTSDGEAELPLEAGVLDRGTLQVALMLDLAAGGKPGPHVMLDHEALKTYRYTVDGRETLATPSGSHETIRVTQQRDGSSRRTILWAAPALSYLPVKIEQRRDGEAITTLTLLSVHGF